MFAIFSIVFSVGLSLRVISGWFVTYLVNSPGVFFSGVLQSTLPAEVKDNCKNMSMSLAQNDETVDDMIIG